MITFVEGNIFDSPAQVVTNTVNTVGVMGKGIALEYKKRFPKMFLDYEARCKNGAVEIGKPYLWEDDKTQILNFPTKRHWREKSELDYIEAGLQYLVVNYQALGICTLALPPLGCGNGGLKWNDVKALITKYFADISDLEVFVYLPRQAASKLDPDTNDDSMMYLEPSGKIASLPLEH
jgi:O-acetyl-ADP-ribose deacetylase (regulator of RNase III)